MIIMSSLITNGCQEIQSNSSGYGSHTSSTTNCSGRSVNEIERRRYSVSESSDCNVCFNDSYEHSSSSSGTEHKGICVNACKSTCRKRKTSRPQRSANKNDPNFRGVTFSVETKVSENAKDVPKTGPKIRIQLHIKSFFSVRKKLRYPDGVWHGRKQSLDLDSNSSGSDQEVSNVPPFIGQPFPEYIPGLGKMCASCGTRRTPLWRDAEDGTPLCNACGIRYKKYRVRCVYCWHIPKKDGKSYPNCARCGDVLRVTLPRRAQYF